MGKCLLGYMKRSGGKNSISIPQGRSQQNLGTGKLEQTSNPLTNKLEGENGEGKTYRLKQIKQSINQRPYLDPVSSKLT